MLDAAGKSEAASKAAASEARVKQQVAAICFRGQGSDKEILLITSRETKRWIVPKGWPIDGLSAAEAAAREAWEEAGVRPKQVFPNPSGTYTYEKRLENGDSVPCEVSVFNIEVKSLEDDFPEMHERKRKWTTPQKAAKLVEERDLKAMLKSF